ncbi:hypothetical protein N7492_006153 [Penicillium capsulatum]|uniref:Uncharacterized protein n=1 Tax=Penicillium capsulatum TaxID=69766 RepID=A0A9W9I6D4_9EURO|nr:hypothetical protein N7492_006153 [Penicillium capsulatum]
METPTTAQVAVLCAVTKPTVLGENPTVAPKDIAAMSILWHCIHPMRAAWRDFPESQDRTDKVELEKRELFCALMVLTIFYKKQTAQGKAVDNVIWATQ